ncbi:hypothetical protein [Zavarzinella formosa]|nr:hypothetical protein [Zavarzinella formosa]
MTEARKHPKHQVLFLIDCHWLYIAWHTNLNSAPSALSHHGNPRP